MLASLVGLSPSANFSVSLIEKWRELYSQPKGIATAWLHCHESCWHGIFACRYTTFCLSHTCSQYSCVDTTSVYTVYKINVLHVCCSTCVYILSSQLQVSLSAPSHVIVPPTSNVHEAASLLILNVSYTMWLCTMYTKHGWGVDVWGGGQGAGSYLDTSLHPNCLEKGYRGRGGVANICCPPSWCPDSWIL